MHYIENLLDIMARLRDRDAGCPWDLQQDFASIAPYTVEEAYEVADTIARGDMEELRGELGDLLFQVVFHAQMAAETGNFDFQAVVATICDKMVRRHPHVFGSEADRSRGAVAGSWERIKAAEKSPGDDGSVLDGIARVLPALKRAEKLGKRAASAGFDWPDSDGVREKIDEELAELDEAMTKDEGKAAEELGDLMFAIVNLARHLRIDPEQALANANRKFEQRFRHMEAEVGARGARLADFDMESLEAEWQAAKDGAAGSGRARS